MKIKYLAITILLLTAALPSLSQYRQQSGSRSGNGLSDRIYFGGGGGFSGGTNYLNLSVSPLIGYKITDRFSAGLQITYQYVKFFDASINNYGGGPFLRLNVTEKLFAYTQYEYMNFGTNVSEERFDFSSLFVGLGYSEPISDKVAFNITALYNLLYRDGSKSPYQSPLVFRVVIVAGLF